MSNSAGRIRSFVERIERLEEEIRALNADKSEVYKEARGEGFDVPTLRKVVAARKKDPTERAEADMLFETYMTALEGPVLVHAHAREEDQGFQADIDTDETIEPVDPRSGDSAVSAAIPSIPSADPDPSEGGESPVNHAGNQREAAPLSEPLDGRASVGSAPPAVVPSHASAGGVPLHDLTVPERLRRVRA